MFSFIYSLITAINAIDKWVSKFFVFYLEKKQEAFDEDFVQAVEDIRRLGDQRAFESLIGAPKAGRPSGKPGVKTRPRKKVE